MLDVAHPEILRFFLPFSVNMILLLPNILNRAAGVIFQLLKMRRRKPRNFFKLIGQMRDAAVIHFPSNFCNIEFAVKN